MTAGEYLLSRSSLSSGTALAHLLAIQAGSGQGTVFASMFSVQVERNEIVVTRKAKRSTPAQAPVVRPSISPAPAKPSSKLSLFTAQPAITVLTAPDEITLTQKTASITVTNRLPSTTIARKRKAGLLQSD